MRQQRVEHGRLAFVPELDSQRFTGPRKWDTVRVYQSCTEVQQDFRLLMNRSRYAEGKVTLGLTCCHLFSGSKNSQIRNNTWLAICFPGLHALPIVYKRFQMRSEKVVYKYNPFDGWCRDEPELYNTSPAPVFNNFDELTHKHWILERISLK